MDVPLTQNRGHLLRKGHILISDYFKFILYLSRLGNLYFLFLVVLNCFPQVEVFHREITMLPLIVVLLASMIKDAIEDYRKYQFDTMTNFSKTRVYDK